jgi:CBS domain-containing protein
MSDVDDDDKHVERLRVRVRRTLSGQSPAAVDLTVFCPLRGETVSLKECTACERCEGVVVDRSGDHAFLRCRCSHDPEEELALAPERGAGSLAGKTPISEVMTHDVICVRDDLSVADLTALFIEKNISGAPVVDAHGKPIGVVSKTDLLREHLSEKDEAPEDKPLALHCAGYDVELGSGLHLARIARSTVGEIMMPIAFTLPETAPIARAAALMAIEGVHRIPVVSDEGKVVGIVSALDVLRWVAREDGYLLSPQH